MDDVAQGLAQGRFAVATTESAVLYVLGVAQLALIRVTQEPAVPFAVSLAQQICTLLLRGLGVPGHEPEAIAAQAADEIVRQSTFRDKAAGAAH